MSKYEYRLDMPAGGFDRDIKYRNPEYFDGIVEKDATAVSVVPGFPEIVSAYAAVGIKATTVGDQNSPVAEEVKEEKEVALTDEQIAALSDEELSALYEKNVGRKPGNMKRETVIAALTEV